VLVAGEETKDRLSTWPRAAAAQQFSGSDGSERERGGGGQRTEGEADGEKKTHGLLCGPFFSFFEKLCLIFFSLPFISLFFLSLFNFLFSLISYR